MKRFTMILALLVTMAMPIRAERVSPETARKVATTFLKNNGAKSIQLTDLSKTAGFPNLYIFKAKPGFVVMSADDRVKPILGYSFTGTFIAEDMPENLRDWLQGYSDDIQYAIDNKVRASTEDLQLWKALEAGKGDVAKATPVVGPLIQTKWNQTKFYNDSCPVVANSDIDNGRAYTGCVATAMAQIMKYYEYPKNPSHGIGSHYYKWGNDTLRADFNSANYDWSSMENYYEYYYDGETRIPLPAPSTTSASAIATLMYHCGVAVNMSYGVQSSSANIQDVVYALREYFNYSPNMEFKFRGEDTEYTDRDGSKWENMVKDELKNKRQPLPYFGSNSNGRGHIFVCDGYDSDNNFHFNLGWSGANDGYYTLSTLQGYTGDQGAIFGIRPATCNATVPFGLTYTLSGQNVTLNWNGGVASNYKIYRNGRFVGSSTTTTYSEKTDFGTNVYYVRAVDDLGQQSLSSNSIVFNLDYRHPVVDDVDAFFSGSTACFTWTSPDWCYPETPTTMLTYGNGSYGGRSSVGYKWAHRFIAENIAQYSGKSVYKVAFYACEEGIHRCYVYEGTSSEDNGGKTYYTPETMLSEKEVLVSNNEKNRWIDIDLDSTALIGGQRDLWVVLDYPNKTGYPAAYTSNTGCEHGKYNMSTVGGSGDNRKFVQNIFDRSYLIRTYVTDGIYTYNIYDGETKLNDEPISDTTYTLGLDNLANNTVHNYTVKTNYYKGESDASNMVSFAVGNASLASLEMAANNKMTVTSGSTLTVTGELINNNTSNFVIEDGAQLIHNTEGVKATVKKDIAPASNGNGWNFIASPVVENITPSETNGLLNGEIGNGNNTYDLYYYEEPAQYWRNYESHSDGFTIEHSKGYLYANGDGTTLQFEGTLTPSENSVTLDNLSHTATELNGFNLVGNPFVCNATVNTDCFVIDSDNNIILAESNRQIAPCESVFVKADNNNGYQVVFTKADNARSNKSSNCIDLVVTQGRSTLDRARVRFGEGTNLEKFTIDRDNNTQLSFWQDGEEYAVAYVDGIGEMPINFKAASDGTHTLSMEPNSLDLEYLHLIDNVTGADIDLLHPETFIAGEDPQSAVPSYTFTAKTMDYASRFKLVFLAGKAACEPDAPFAFISNGEIRLLVETTPETSLQIVDMLGRIVVSCRGDVSGNVSTEGMTAGVYVLRLINGDEVKTQKIVVR